jgi:hypothetical protein
MKIADLTCDVLLLKEAQSAAEELISADPALTEHPVIAARIKEWFPVEEISLN